MSDWDFLNKHRVISGKYASDPSYGFNGAFQFMVDANYVRTIASDGRGWQHVSVSLIDNPHATPKWSVMCKVKDLFWEPEEVVVQFHPRASEYVSHHPGCLHLWRCIDGREFPTPEPILVGPKVTGAKV